MLNVEEQRNEIGKIWDKENIYCEAKEYYGIWQNVDIVNGASIDPRNETEDYIKRKGPILAIYDKDFNLIYTQKEAVSLSDQLDKYKILLERF